MDSPELAGETALVTGAGKRVGRAIALELARAGAAVAVHVNRSRDEGAAVAREVEALGAASCVVSADQRDVDAIERACAEAATTLGPVSLLVCSAAIWPRVELERCTREDFDLALEVNLRGPFFWARFLGPAMKRRGRGAIVSIADVSAFRPWPDALPYCMAKAGLVAMTYGLAKALAPEVRVMAVPETWVPPKPGTFQPDVMNELADLGERMGAEPASWRTDAP